MKNLSTLCVLLSALFIMVGCAPAVTGGDTISFAQAFGVVITRASYLIPLLIVTALSGVAVSKAVKRYRETQEVGTTLAIIAIAVVVFAFTLLYAPCEIAANTTIEQFQRGVIINP